MTEKKDELRNLFKELFPGDGAIEDFDIKTKSEFTEAILSDVFIDLQKGEDKYQKLQIGAQWNPPQVVEVEPPEQEDLALRIERKVWVTPLRK